MLNIRTQLASIAGAIWIVARYLNINADQRHLWFILWTKNEIIGTNFVITSLYSKGGDFCRRKFLTKKFLHGSTRNNVPYHLWVFLFPTRVGYACRELQSGALWGGRDGGKDMLLTFFVESGMWGMVFNVFVVSELVYELCFCFEHGFNQ